MSLDSIWRLTPSEKQSRGGRSGRTMHPLPTQIRFRRLGLASSGKALEPNERPFRKRSYLVKLQRVLDWLMTVAIEVALIAILIAMFILAAIFVLDVPDMW